MLSHEEEKRALRLFNLSDVSQLRPCVEAMLRTVHTMTGQTIDWEEYILQSIAGYEDDHGKEKEKEKETEKEDIKEGGAAIKAIARSNARVDNVADLSIPATNLAHRVLEQTASLYVQEPPEKKKEKEKELFVSHYANGKVRSMTFHKEKNKYYAPSDVPATMIEAIKSIKFPNTIHLQVVIERHDKTLWKNTLVGGERVRDQAHLEDFVSKWTADRIKTVEMYEKNSPELLWNIQTIIKIILL